MPLPDRPAEPSRKLAAATLGIAADADAPTVRAAFFRKLAAFDFAPPEDWNAAATRLGAPLPRSAAAVEAQAGFEMADVREFLAEYWNLPPEERKSRWVELDGRCRHAEACAALKRVKEGTEVAVRAHVDALVDDIARLAYELYPLPPHERAICRRVWCARLNQVEDSATVGDRFRAAYPDLANLVPELIEVLCSGVGVPRAVEALDRETLSRLKAEAEWKARQPVYLPHAGASPRLRKALLLGCLLALGLFAVAALWMASAPRARRNNTPASTPTLGESQPWNSQSTQQADERKRLIDSIIATRPLKSFTSEEIRRFKEYDPQSGRPEPPNYKLWRNIERLDKPRSTSPTKR
jgi:hypothetical protein